MKKYNFTEKWFNPKELTTIFQSFPKQEINFLEIGSFEGESTVWFIENILTNENSKITCIDPWSKYSQDNDSFNSYNKPKTEWDFSNHKNTFLSNIKKTGFENKVIIIEGLSHEKLPILISEGNLYDIIYIDGNHTSAFVLTDAIMSWFLLKKGGMMIFDDYLWGKPEKTSSPKIGVDSFIKSFQDYLDITHNDYRIAIRKK